MVKTESFQDIFINFHLCIIYSSSRIYINSFKNTESYSRFKYLKYLDWFFKVTICTMKLAIIYPGLLKHHLSLIFE